MPQVLCFGKKNLVYIAVSGGQGLIFSRLILVVRKGDGWDLGIFASHEVEGRSISTNFTMVPEPLSSAKLIEPVLREAVQLTLSMMS